MKQKNFALSAPLLVALVASGSWAMERPQLNLSHSSSSDASSPNVARIAYSREFLMAIGEEVQKTGEVDAPISQALEKFKAQFVQDKKSGRAVQPAASCSPESSQRDSQRRYIRITRKKR